MPNAFLSYSRASESTVPQICDDLMRCGIDEVWWDKRLVGAQSWWDTILGQIRAADVVVCLIDEGMPESTAVRREYQYAIDLGKPLLPVLLSDHVEISTLPIQLAGKQYVDYRPDCPAPVKGLLVAVRNLPPAPVLPNPLPPEPPIPISERDYLIEKVNSTEPLEHEVQVDVLSRLRRLERSAEIGPREFAQASLKRLRNRPELLASVADDIDAVDRAPVIERPGGRGLTTGAVVVCVAALLLVAGYFFYPGMGNPINSNSNNSAVTSLADKPDPANTGSVDDDSAGKQELNDSVVSSANAESEYSAGTPLAEDVAKAPASTIAEPLTDEIVEPTTALAGPEANNDEHKPVASVNQEPVLLSKAEPVNNQDSVSGDVEGATAVSASETPSSEDTAASKLDSMTLPEPVSASDAQAFLDTDADTIAKKDVDENARTIALVAAGETTIQEASSSKDWEKDFTVFSQTSFKLCGFEQFTAVPNTRGEGNMIEVRSKDRSIPDQPFRGLHVQVPSDQLFEIFPGCRILLTSEVTSGISRIRVRAKGAR